MKYFFLLSKAPNPRKLNKTNKHKKPKKEQLISKIYFSRRNCSQTENKKFIKDIFLIKDRHIKDIVFLDYKAESLSFNLGNLVLIPFWSGEIHENVLENYVVYLENLAKSDDCRSEILKDMNYRTFMSLIEKCEYVVS